MSHDERDFQRRGWETLKQGSWRLKVSAPTIIRWAKRGLVPCVHLNARVVYFDLSNPPKTAKWKPTQKNHIPMIGSNHPRAKICEDDVRAIRKIMANAAHGALTRLARTYNVTHGTIWRACKGDTWKHVSV